MNKLLKALTRKVKDKIKNEIKVKHSDIFDYWDNIDYIEPCAEDDVPNIRISIDLLDAKVNMLGNIEIPYFYSIGSHHDPYIVCDEKEVYTF